MLNNGTVSMARPFDPDLEPGSLQKRGAIDTNEADCEARYANKKGAQQRPKQSPRGFAQTFSFVAHDSNFLRCWVYLTKAYRPCGGPKIEKPCNRCTYTTEN